MRAGHAVGAKTIYISKNRKEETAFATQPDLRTTVLNITRRIMNSEIEDITN